MPASHTSSGIEQALMQWTLNILTIKIAVHGKFKSNWKRTSGKLCPTLDSHPPE
jgi:hypothetical protein